MRGMRVLALVALGLAGCEAQTPSPAMPVPPAPDDCGASELQHLVGQPKSALDAENITGPLRILPPGSAMTMDYRPDRLNVELDKTGRIIRLWCV